MRLIDADAFKRYLDDGDECINCQKKGMFCSYHCELDNVESNQFERIIDEQPTIDAVEVVHGEWIKSDDGTECSCCGFALEDWIHGIFYNFCPNCGASMHNPCADCQEFDCYGCEYKNGARR